MSEFYTTTSGLLADSLVVSSQNLIRARGDANGRPDGSFPS